MISFRSNIKTVFKKIEQKATSEFTALRREVAEMSVKHYKKSFDREGFNNVPFMHWKLLKRPRPSPYTNNKILHRTGKLKNSLKYRTRVNKGSISVNVFTDVEYAQVHNEGLWSGRGKGFKMPKRKFLGYSKVLEKDLAKRVKYRLSRIK